MEEHAEDQDLAVQAKKKLGMPDYDSNAPLLQTLPKVLKLA